MKDLDRLIRLAGPRPQATAAGRARARAAVHDAWTEVVTTRARRRLFVGAVALAAAAVLAAVVMPWRPTPAEPVVVGTMAGRVLRTGATVLTGTGQLAVVNMAGGGQLRLNGNTSIRLTGLRQIGMHRGQIYVDAGGPGLDDLAVTTPVGVLRDVGTRFDVLMEGTSVRVRVRDGVVRLTAGGIVTDASAGQQLLAEPGAPVVVGVGTTYGPDWDWILRAAPFQADGAQLEAFLRWVEIEGGLTVDFADPTLRQRAGQTVLHGSIENLGLEDALDVILPASGLTHRTVGGRIVITGAGSSR